MKHPRDRLCAARMPRGAVLALLLSALSLFAPGAQAHIDCIAAGDVAYLQAVLAADDHNNEDDIIELEAGEYSMPSNFPLYYSASTEVNSLTIEGGYTADFSGPCGSPPTVPDAALTVLDGGIFRIHMAGTGSFSLRGVTIENTFSTDPLDSPVEIGGYGNATGTFTLQHVMLLDNASTAKAAVYIFAGDGGLFIQDALFANNLSASASESAVHVGSLSTGGSFCTVILNSTFADNSSPMAPALDVHTQMCDTIAANDIFWHGVAGAVQFDVPQSTYLSNDDFEDLSEAANAAQASALLSVDPLFYTDYSLHDFSPLRDKGLVFSLESFDVVGNPRVDGANPDIGAFETHDVIFANGFEM